MESIGNTDANWRLMQPCKWQLFIHWLALQNQIGKFIFFVRMPLFMLVLVIADILGLVYSSFCKMHNI